MGPEDPLLLVSPRCLCGLLACLALAACSAPAEVPRVDPRDHHAFFLWAGVRPPEVLARASAIYILSGEVRRADPANIVPLRAVPHVRHAEVWLVLRIERTDLAPSALAQLDRELARWQAAGNQLVGVQIDFDAATQGLDRYAAFLRDLRRRLPPRYRLSVTGLMDWSAHGDPDALAGLAGVVDEVVIQTYQGRHTIPGYEGYLRRLARLPMPYRIGVVEGGAWQEPATLRADPHYRGTVVFLLGR